MKKLLVGIIALTSLSTFADSPSRESYSIDHLGNGAKLVLKKDLFISGNTDSVKLFQIKETSEGGANDCFLFVNSAPKDRVYAAGKEIVFSGEGSISDPAQEPGNLPGETYFYTDYVAQIKAPSAFTKLSCLKVDSVYERNPTETFWNYGDLPTMDWLRKNLAGQFELVLSDPTPIP